MEIQRNLLRQTNAGPGLEKNVRVMTRFGHLSRSHLVKRFGLHSRR